MVNQTKKPHVHAECIKAWADGIKVQFKLNGDIVWNDLDNSGWCNWSEKTEYRIKPEPKPDVIHYGMAVAGNPCTTFCSERHYANYHNLKLTFDGETDKLKKAEVIG